MKKGLKLLALVIACSALSVNADTIDMNDEFFSNHTIYKSGDRYTNVLLRNGISGVNFYTPVGMMSYDIPMPSAPLNDSGTSTRDKVFRVYINNRVSEPIFDIDFEESNEIVIPKYFGRETLWGYSLNQYSKIQPSDDSSNIELYDDFYPLMFKPEFEIRCDNENVGYNEKGSCSLIYKFSVIDRYAMPYIVDLMLSSDEYNLSNIIVNPISSMNVDDTKISGYVVDQIKVKEYISNIMNNAEMLDLKTPDAINKFLEKELDIKSNYICLSEIVVPKLSPSSSQPSLGGRRIIGDKDCNGYSENEIKLATFDISPKRNDSINGSVKLSSAKIGFVNNRPREIGHEGDDEPMLMDFDYTLDGEVNSVVPIIAEEVKGVEEVTENPKTGIVNYIYLLPLVFISIYVYHFIKKNKELFR